MSSSQDTFQEEGSRRSSSMVEERAVERIGSVDRQGGERRRREARHILEHSYKKVLPFVEMTKKQERTSTLDSVPFTGTLEVDSEKEEIGVELEKRTRNLQENFEVLSKRDLRFDDLQDEEVPYDIASAYLQEEGLDTEEALKVLDPSNRGIVKVAHLMHLHKIIEEEKRGKTNKDISEKPPSSPIHRFEISGEHYDGVVLRNFPDLTKKSPLASSGLENLHLRRLEAELSSVRLSMHSAYLRGGSIGISSQWSPECFESLLRAARLKDDLERELDWCQWALREGRGVGGKAVLQDLIAKSKIPTAPFKVPKLGKEKVELFLPGKECCFGGRERENPETNGEEVGRKKEQQKEVQINPSQLLFYPGASTLKEGKDKEERKGNDLQQEDGGSGEERILGSRQLKHVGKAQTRGYVSPERSLPANVHRRGNQEDEDGMPLL